MATIFWVEDQFHWINKFQSVLVNADFSVAESSKNGQQSLSRTPNKVIIHKFVESACQSINQMKVPPDVVILDANMNGNDDAGLTVSSLISKKWPDVPVIFLSEHSGTGIEEKVFESTTTQDFIAKHQANIEKVLCWRIRALLRHKQIPTAQQDASLKESLVSGDLTMNLATWNVYWCGERLMNPVNGQRPLAPTPRKILRYLVESSPRPVSTLQMEEKLQSERFNYASYRQHIKTLRHSFEQASAKTKQTSFQDWCKQGKGIVTFGDDGAYCWVPV